MATYPIKMLKDENNTPFVPLVGANAIVYNDTETLEEKLDKKLEKTNIIGGDNITLSVDGNNITINSGAGSSTTLMDNLTTSTAGQGALDANQGRILNTNKQDKLISGTNLKTINNESLLGSGNITVSASPEISIGTTTPSDDEVLWIDPTEDYINTATEVINNLNGDETSLAPSVRAVKNDLIQSGSNNNGSWIKFPDGTMICRGFKNIGGTTTGGNADGSLYYVDITLTHNFPQEFINIPNIKINVYTNEGQTYHSIWAVLKASSYSKQGINGYRIYSPTNTTFNYSIDYIAIGRWK